MGRGGGGLPGSHAKRGAELYDKFSGFVDDFCKLGDRLTQARDSYDSAYSKFAKGRGNLPTWSCSLKIPSKRSHPNF